MDASTAVRGARLWPALTAWGAGLIQIALGAGVLTRTQGGGVLEAAAIVLIGLGAAGFAWGGTALARGRLVVPRAGVAGVLSGLVAMTVALAADPAGISILAVAAAAALLVATGAGITTRRRSDASRSGVAGITTRRRSDASRSGVVGILVSAILVAAVVTPALAAAEVSHLTRDGQPVAVSGHRH